MSTKSRTVLLAVAFGLAATAVAAFYLNTVRASIVESGVKQSTLVAVQAIPAGTPVAGLAEAGLVKLVDIPKSYRVAGALARIEAKAGQVLTADLAQGEQLARNKIRSEDQSELAFKLSPDKIAVAVPVDEVIGVAGQIQPGDKVVVLATFSPGPQGDMSRVLLRNILVLSADTPKTKGTMAASASAGAKQTLTLALTPTEAEKLTLAEEKGKVRIGLIPAGTDDLPATGGQTMETIFK